MALLACSVVEMPGAVVGAVVSLDLELREGRVVAAGLEEEAVAEGFLEARVLEEVREEDDVPETVMEEEEG